MGLQFGSRWLLNIFLLASLGDQDFGVFAFIYSIANFSMAVLPFGSQVYLIKSGSEPQKAKTVFHESLASTYFIFVLLLVLFAGLNYFIDQPYGFILYLGFILGLLFSVNAIIFSYLKALGSFKFDLLLNSIFSGMIGVLIVASYLHYPIAISGYFYALIVINLITLVLCFILSPVITPNDLSCSLKFNKLKVFRSLKERGYYGFQDILTASFVQGGMLIVPLLVTASLYGKYRGILLITAPFALINVAFSQVLLQNITGKSIQQLKKFFHKLQLITIPLLVGALIGLYFLREPLLQIIAKTALDAETQTAFILIICIILSRFVYAGYEMALVAMNKQKYRFWIMLVGAIVNIGSIYVLLPAYGLIGALLTNVISSIVVVLLLSIITEWLFKKERYVRNFRES